MNIDDIFDQIESVDFEADLMIASGFTLFLTILAQHDLVKQLATQITNNSQLLIEHIKHLMESKVDSAYRHPYDASLSAYLFVLNESSNDNLLSIAEKVADLENGYWSVMLAQHIMKTDTLSASDKPA